MSGCDTDELSVRIQKQKQKGVILCTFCSNNSDITLQNMNPIERAIRHPAIPWVLCATLVVTLFCFNDVTFWTHGVEHVQQSLFRRRLLSTDSEVSTTTFDKAKTSEMLNHILKNKKLSDEESLKILNSFLAQGYPQSSVLKLLEGEMLEEEGVKMLLDQNKITQEKDVASKHQVSLTQNMKAEEAGGESMKFLEEAYKALNQAQNIVDEKVHQVLDVLEDTAHDLYEKLNTKHSNHGRRISILEG